MKKTVVVAFFLFTVAVSSSFGQTQNITFNGYWELPDGNIFLVKERLFFFAGTNGKLTGETGCFSYTNKQLTLQHPNVGIIPFDYTVIDSGSIRVTDTSGKNAWAQGIWKKRTNIPGTTVKHQIIGYWEGKDGDNTEIMYIAGKDIVPPYDLKWFGGEKYSGQLAEQDGWSYTFDRENNLKEINPLFIGLNGNAGNIFFASPPGFDSWPWPFRFDGSVLVLNYANREIRFVKK